MSPSPVRTPDDSSAGRLPIAAALAWALPGLGHWYLGHRTRAIYCFVAITLTFWAGVAVGGVRTTIHPTLNGGWFAAQLCMGPQALAAWGAGRYVDRAKAAEIARGETKYTAFYASDNISVVYAGIAGLLNLLVIIDAMARAEPSASARITRGPPGATR